MRAPTSTPTWVPVFLLIISLIAVYDMSYIHLHPATAESGRLGKYFRGHHAYAKVDTLFQAPEQSPFLKAVIGPLSAVEIVLNVLVAVLWARSSPATAPVALIGNTYIIAKTVLYMAYDYPSLDLSDLSRAVLLYFTPNLQWVILPTVACVQISNQVSSSLQHALEAKRL
mmetsp:Transcript_11065/g.33946  ORF Transcript_11065/g.33946 Transcript_11065/m.33946 type:complete len:170 (+) Transcript_11065:225-734(+)